MTLDALLQHITTGIEIVGTAVIVAGAVISLAAAAMRLIQRRPPQECYRLFRAGLGRSILLGLEFLVAADIIGTVALEPTLTSVGVLAGVVLIRTFLSFALEVEIEGRLPWKAPRGQA